MTVNHEKPIDLDEIEFTVEDCMVWTFVPVSVVERDGFDEAVRLALGPLRAFLARSGLKRVGKPESMLCPDGSASLTQKIVDPIEERYPHRVEVSRGFLGRGYRALRRDVRRWCRSNCRHWVRVFWTWDDNAPRTWAGFVSDEDAALFRLYWT